MSARHRPNMTALRLRLGVVLWLLSWVPYAVIFSLGHPWRQISWGIEVLLGIAGLALAGSVFAESVKSVGWRHAPGAVWRALIHGDPGTAPAQEPA